MRGFTTTRPGRLAVAAVAAAIGVVAAGGIADAQGTGTPRETTAPATAGCPGDGHLDTNYVCTSLSGGGLFHRKYTNDVISTWYTKTGGSAITAKLGFSASGKTHWGGSFTESSGQTKTANWSGTGVAYCTLTVGLISVAGQGMFQTPQATGC
ncbi:hypothetical protein [Actinacidiphila sp. ITFR-21]|uniref:hypothetical protein n=1 Tax=Actinacidiphila sp. ITFR-21 TaxID=3075199 RepID=UPI00288B84A6|nr:hypothetical protein [Streptomyces sp. ITFR-21]WNI16032.1 hypothetical protein RLT57_11175 [Streptomyces sp. ITFR-21]